MNQTCFRSEMLRVTQKIKFLSKAGVLALSLLFFSHIAIGQNSFSGLIYDSLDLKAIPFASVSLVKAQDSSLVSFTRSNPKGNFQLKNLDAGNYILLVAHAKYFIYTEEVNITADLNRGQILLFQKTKMLKQVLVKAKSAITIRGDTIKYYADSFQTKRGAVVEDLLKKLPGMEVDQNGNIKSHGKEVKKVLVNGEEFFGADPTIATQNLPSKAVEDVVVYDYKDEQESFTGFTSDEEKTKVIDLKLKKEMNKGGFLKASLAGGWEDRWAQKLLLNRFRDKEQMGIYYLASSNEMANLSWEEGQDFGTTNTSFGDDGMMYTYMTRSGDGMGNPFQGQAQYGITKSWKTGARYSNKFDTKNQSLNANYSFLRANRNRNFKRYTENLIPGAQFNKIDSSRESSKSDGHNFYINYKTDLDSLTNLNIRTSIGTRNNQIQGQSSYFNNSLDEVPISFNERTTSGENRRNSIENIVNLKKKFKLEGRTVSLRLDQKNNTTRGIDYNKSTNALDLQNGGNTFNLDQAFARNRVTNSISTNLVLTEPLTKKLRLKLSYRFNSTKSDQENLVSDTIGFVEGNYSNQLDSLSNIFLSKQTNHRPGFELRYELEKWRFSLRNSVSFNQFKQDDLLRDANFDYQQTNIIPGLSARYKLSKYKTFRISYSGNTSTPRAQQIQPFPDISNPLNVIVGNPNLRMAYNQRFRFSYSGYSPLEGSNLYAMISFRNSINKIGTSRTFEESGRTSTTYFNMPNSYGLSGYTYMGQRIKDSKFRISTGIDADYSYNPNRINNIDGFNARTSLTINPGISYDNPDLLEFRFTSGATWNLNSNNLRDDIQYIEYSPSLDLQLWLPNHFSIAADIEYNYTPAVAPYTTPFTRLFGNLELNKKVLSDRSLELYFTVFDLFNQNNGYDRQSRTNYNSESFYNTLGRYWMFGARWGMFKGPGSSEKRNSTEKTGTGWSKLFEKSEK